MSTLLIDYLSAVVLGEPRPFRNMTVVPVFVSVDRSPDYLTLSEAMAANWVTVTEVNQGGHVPNLKVTNRGASPVLLLDGEELVGARQNRVLNTSMLLRPKSETTIPVSCTEKCRWAHRTHHMHHSGHLVSSQLRKIKSSSVQAGLRQAHTAAFAADQAGIWAAVDGLSHKSRVISPTHALADVFSAKRLELDAYLEAFRPAPDQKGLVVLVNDEVLGLDAVSLARAYQVLHAQLIHSYALDALVAHAEATDPNVRKGAAAFLEQSKACSETAYPAVGEGTDHRFVGPGVAGAALVAEDMVLHLNLYRLDVHSPSPHVSPVTA